MQGLVNFAGQIGNAIAILLPTFCYAAALVCFLFAGWGFWMQSHPDNPFRGKPWIPFVSLVLSGVFSTFDRTLTMANATAGTNLTSLGHGPDKLYAADDRRRPRRGTWRDGGQCRAAFSRLFSELRRYGMLFRVPRLALGRQRPEQPVRNELRRSIRVRGDVDQYRHDHAMARHHVPGVMSALFRRPSSSLRRALF